MNNENKVLFNAIIEELGRMEERMNKGLIKLKIHLVRSITRLMPVNWNVNRFLF